MDRRQRIRLFLITAIVIVCAVPCALALYSFFWPSIRFKMSLRVYPLAQEVGSNFDYLDTNTGYQVSYYWTGDAEQDVRAYYTAFTEPFRGDKTIFHPYGEEQNEVENQSCYYQKFTCVEIQLLDFGDGRNVTLPDVMLENRFSRTPVPSLSPPIKGGTLIIYSFYTDEW